MNQLLVFDNIQYQKCGQCGGIFPISESKICDGCIKRSLPVNDKQKRKNKISKQQIKTRCKKCSTLFEYTRTTGTRTICTTCKNHTTFQYTKDYLFKITCKGCFKEFWSSYQKYQKKHVCLDCKEKRITEYQKSIKNKQWRKEQVSKSSKKQYKKLKTKIHFIKLINSLRTNPYLKEKKI